MVWFKQNNSLKRSLTPSVRNSLIIESEFSDQFKRFTKESENYIKTFSSLPYAPGFQNSQLTVNDYPAETPQFTTLKSFKQEAKGAENRYSDVYEQRITPTKRRIKTDDTIKILKALESLELNMTQQIENLSQKNEEYEKRLKKAEVNSHVSKETLKTISFRLEEMDVKLNVNFI